MSNDTTLVAKPNRAQEIKEIIDADGYRKRFDELLGKRAPQFVSSIVTAGQSSGLVRCTPRSIVASALIAATLDFPIDKNLGFAYLVPYGTEAQFQLGYRGFVQLALRSGQYQRLNACAINAEAFAGYDEIGEPLMDWKKFDPVKPVAGYFAGWKLINGFVKSIYWPGEQVEAHAQRFSQAYRAKKKDSPWFTDFDAMGIKTVLKNGLSRWGILSVEMQTALAADGADDVPYDLTPVPQPQNTLAAMIGAPSDAPIDIPGEAANPDLEPSTPKPEEKAAEKPVTPPAKTYTAAEREALLKECEALMLDNGISESAVLIYCHRQKLAKKEQDAVGSLDTGVLDELRAVIPSLKKKP